MSGGTFEYFQYHINDIADTIEKYIKKNGKKKSEKIIREESEWRRKDWYDEYPEDLSYYKYPDEVIAEFKNGVNLLRKAAVYAQRIDWLLAGDDGEKSFITRLKEDLDKLKLYE